MKRPNQELFRLVRFAIQYPGWHVYQNDAAKHVKRAAELGFFDIDTCLKMFRLKVYEK